MIVNISDRNGRALEYKVALALSNVPNFKLSTQAQLDNQRDISKFTSLPLSLQNSYDQASQRIATWVAKTTNTNGNVLVDRLGDEADDVSDIRLTYGSSELNLSLKHNHHALKHPRPYSFAQFCGYATGTAEDLKHRVAMEKIGQDFRKLANKNTMFRDCSESDIDFLYSEVCLACATSLQQWMQHDKHVANNLFRFLVSTGFYKVIVETKTNLVVKIQDYLNIPSPSAVSTLASGNRLILKFNNGWEINNRIHTASSRISAAGNQLSLKFDTQRTAGVITEITI